jgi:hypothetical protein
MIWQVKPAVFPVKWPWKILMRLFFIESFLYSTNLHSRRKCLTSIRNTLFYLNKKYDMQKRIPYVWLWTDGLAFRWSLLLDYRAI